MRYLFAILKIGLLLVALAAIAAISGYLTIRVVTGKESVVVPDVVGLPMTEAMRRLEGVGLGLQIEEDAADAFSESIPFDHVLRQNPEPGSILKRDRKVRVVRSLGARKLFVPRVIGEPVNTAQVRVHDSGLGLGDVIYVDHPDVPDGLVIDQEPPRLGAGGDDRVNFLVSSGTTPRAYVMPDVIARPADDVRSTFERAGFRLRIERELYDGVPPGTVVRQKPLAGYLVRAGDIVLLFTSQPSARSR